jgi:hypothetical protein
MLTAVQFWARKFSVRRRRIIGFPPARTLPAVPPKGKAGEGPDEMVAKGAAGA